MVSRQSSAGGWAVAVIVLAAVVAAGGYLAYRAMHPEAPPTPVAAPAGTATTAANAPMEHHPIMQASAPASASTAPLPPLDDSDASVRSALGALPGGDGLLALLIPSQIIPRIVATVDALPRHTLGRSVLPVQAPKGAFVALQSGGATVADPRNAERYAPYLQALQGVDTQALVDGYVHAYPLFQQAYRQLGYPHGYFNDRLIVAIDNLLATPELAQPAALTAVNGHYEYADPSLEALSAGQKILLRTGPADEAAIKARLREIRARLTGRSLPAAP
ncbi:DUF3014 domain-containing protein [Fulvimonas sp. R45]|uniref:DUF3014 domain-containing protein n=1 Tax=Fulvimonas sp. R45 TaxID=3045937 RepID=UPI00265FDF25|nr:DUF3014 domain-containing protein [Fulvimonas sp. R45]